MGEVPELKIPIFAALDVDSDIRALKIAESINEFVGGFKIGPRLTYKYGAKLVKRLSEILPVFVDNKYYDIPNTVQSALRTTFESGATFATIHASNGPDALLSIRELESQFNQIRPFKILAVTVLTSYNDINMPSNWLNKTPAQHVDLLVKDLAASKLSGVVCSPHEISVVKNLIPQAFIVTPGIRMSGDQKGDQARIMSPNEALKAGASALVVGRPIVEAEDPKIAAQKIWATLNI